MLRSCAFPRPVRSLLSALVLTFLAAPFASLETAAAGDLTPAPNTVDPVLGRDLASGAGPGHDDAERIEALETSEPKRIGGEIEVPTNEEIEDSIPEGTTLAARDIWERYLENKLHSAVQSQTIVSMDPGGNDQRSSFWVRWKDYRDENKEPVDGLVAKTLIKFTDPFDMRYTGMLMILRENGGSEQFVYRPSTRTIRRVKLADAGVMGTDFTFGDIAYQDIENSTYTRHPDEMIEGVPVYVVEARVKPEIKSQYNRTISYLEKEHYVPVRARYWDTSEVEIKEMKAKPSSLKEFHGVWIYTDSTMHNLKEGTSSTLLVEDLDPNIEIAEQLFSTFRLALRR